MKELSSEQLSKLPKWAQTAFERLMRENAELAEALDEMNGKVEDDTYSVLLKSGYGNERAVTQKINGTYGIDILLPAVPERKYEKRSINLRVKDGMLQIMSTGHPSSLAVMPQSSNVVILNVVEKPWEVR